MRGQKGEIFTNTLLNKLSNISSNSDANAVANDSACDLSGFTLEPEGTPIHVGNVANAASVNRSLTSKPEGIFKVHENVRDENTKDVAKHISVYIVESPTSSKIGEEIQSRSDSKIRTKTNIMDVFITTN